MTTLDLDFIEEEIPSIVRVGGSGAQPVKWEELLAPLKAEDKVGKSYRVWQYEKKTGATSRVASVRNRLNDVVPGENWKIAVREVPGSSPVMFGVYVEFVGIFTEEEVADRAKLRKERGDRIRAARAAVEVANEVLDNTEAPVDPAPTTAAQKVAAAKQAASKK